MILHGIDSFGSGPSTSNIEYQITLEFINVSELWFPTDDAGSGIRRLRGNALWNQRHNLSATPTSGVNGTYNSTTGDLEELHWDGYVSATNDKDDAYQFRVPQGYFYEICVEWDGQNWWGFDPNTMIRVFAYGDGSDEYPSSSGFWNTFPTPEHRGPSA